MTLDQAIEAYRAEPSEETAVNLRATANEYGRDGMIIESEVIALFAESEDYAE